MAIALPDSQRRRFAALLLPLLLLPAGACQRDGASSAGAAKPDPPLLARLRVRDRTPRASHPIASLADDQLLPAVRARLAANRIFTVPEVDVAIDRASDRRTFSLFAELLLSRMRTGVGVLDPGVARADVFMEMERVAGGPGLEAYAAKAAVDRPLVIPDGTTPEQFWLDVAVAATAKAFESVEVQYRARDRTLDELLSDLERPDVSVRVAAVRQIGERRDGRALKPLVRLLDDAHQDVVLASVGALGNLRDPQAAHALVESTRGRSSEYLASVVGALRTLGGVEAEAFLETISVGHGDPDLRAKAASALDYLRSGQLGSHR